MNLQQVTQAITDDLRTLVNTIANDIGTNPKTGRNTLASSNLIKNTDIKVNPKDGSVVIDILFDNYVNYIEHGRKPRTGKQPPIDALRDWALERNIPTDNSTLFLISRAIWRDGIEGRPILATLEEEIDHRMEGQWGDMLSEAAMQEIKNLFK